MQISFNPPLRKTVRVSALPGAKEVRLSCRATFSSTAEFEEFLSSGAKVELWSNFPVAGRPKGDWAEHVFDIPREEAPSSSSPPAIFLGGTNDGVLYTEKAHSLVLELDMLASEQAVFEYTYRMVFPTGDIRWLGHFGRNGRLSLVKGDDRIILGKGWNTQPNGDHVWETNSDDSDRLEVEVAQFAADFKYDVRVIGTDDTGSWLTDLSSGPLCIVVPHPDAVSVARPDAFALVASNGSLLYIDGKNVRFASVNGGSLAMKNFSRGSNPHAFFEEVLPHIASPRLRAVRCETAGCCILASTESIAPPSALAVCLFPHPTGSEVSISTKNLANLVPNVRELSIFSISGKTFQILSIGGEQGESYPVSLRFRGSFGSFGVAEVFTLGGEEGSWQASVVSRHTKASFLKSELVTDLPTPPPTPKPFSLSKPAPRRRSSTQSQSDASNQLKLGTPPNDGHLDTRSIPSTLNSITQMGIWRYLTLVLMAVTVLLRSLLVRMLGDVRTKRLAQMASNRLNHSTSTSSQSQDRPSDSEQQPDNEYVPDDPNEEAKGHEEYEHTESKTEDEAPKSNVFGSLVVDVPAGNISIALRRLNGDVSIDAMKIEVDGMGVQRTISDLGEGAFWMDARFSDQAERVKLTVI